VTKDTVDDEVFTITSVTDDDITRQVAANTIDLSESWFCLHVIFLWPTRIDPPAL
jgi:hypothetical protein